MPPGRRARRGSRKPRGAEARRAPTPGSDASAVCAASTIDRRRAATMRFGTIRCSRSVAETATSAAQKNAATSASSVRPNARTQADDEQRRWRARRRGSAARSARRRAGSGPRRSAYERSGTLSYQAIGAAAHAGGAAAGRSSGGAARARRRRSGSCRARARGRSEQGGERKVHSSSYRRPKPGLN